MSDPTASTPEASPGPAGMESDLPVSDQAGTAAQPGDAGATAAMAEAGVQAAPATAEPETAAPELPAPEPVRHTHEGVNYLALISAIHRQMRPASYLEVGSEKGDLLRLATCATIAVDPRFKITSDVMGEKPALHLIQDTSDAAFASGQIQRLLPKGLDLAFLDGMHLFEYLLRDFINTEKLCHWRSAILLHDCLPPNIEIAERDYRPHLRTDEMWRIYWTGDVWKLIPILQRFRPELRLTLFDAAPSGLVMITGLDPLNTVLERAYADILAEYRGFEFDEESYHRFYDGLTLTPSRTAIDGMSLSAFL